MEILHNQRGFVFTQVVRILNSSKVLLLLIDIQTEANQTKPKQKILYSINQERTSMWTDDLDIPAAVSAAFPPQINGQSGSLLTSVFMCLRQDKQRQSTNQHELYIHFLSLITKWIIVALKER